MRLERMELDGFGRFNAASWDLPPGLSVLLGANEAGKTTLLNALRALLFGFEPSRDGRPWYPPLAGGRRGGRLVLRTRDDERWVVERHGERGGAGALAVRSPAGNQGGQETLDRLLHGADKDLYTNIFAFGLGELQTFGSLSAEGVRGRIYGARAGLGGTSAIDLERRLRQEMDADFLPTGSKRPLNALLARIEEMRAEIATLARAPQEHAEADRERTRHVAEAHRAREEARRMREELARLRSLRDATPIVAALDEIETELASGDASLDGFPTDAVTALDRHLGAVETARAVVATLDREIGEARRERDGITVNERLLESAGEIGSLLEEAVRRRDDAHRRAELAATVERATATVRAQVARSGGMTEGALLALDGSIPTVEAIGTHAAALDRARSAHAEAEMRLRALDDDAGDDAGDDHPTDVASPDLETRLAAFRELDRLRIERVSGAVSARVGMPRIVVAAATVVVATLVGMQLGAVFAGAAVGVLIAAAIVATGRPAPPRDLELRWAEACRRAGLPPGATAADVATVGERLAAERARAEIGAGDRARREARHVRLSARRRDVEDAATALRGAEEAWCAWLAERGLASMSPEALHQLIAAAAVARDAAAERDAAAARVAELDRSHAAHAERVDVLLTALGATDGADEASRDGSLRRIGDRLEGAREAHRRSTELEARIGQLEGRREPALADLATAERALAGELRRTGAPDPDTLRQRAAAAARRRELHAAAREHRQRLAGMAGPDRLATFEADVRAGDPVALETRMAEAAEGLEQAEARFQESSAAIGALEARIAQLEADDDLGDRRQELAALEGQAAAMARRWAVGALTLRLLAATRARHERERQPDVVRAAEAHFARITDGRYTRIVAPPGEAAVRVETEGGESRATDELSRGTAEQLYLALRFGLIEEFAAHAEPLPVVMDDILVNFDAERASRAASAIRALSDRHQVLYFTCHTWTAQLLDPDGKRTVALG